MYSFYLAGTLLPITPSKLQISIKNKNQTVDIINIGQVNILKNAGLSDVSFEFVVPVGNNYPFARELKAPEYYFSLLEKLKTDKKPFLFSVVRDSNDNRQFFATNMQVSLEEYEIIENATDGLDVTFKVSLKQYREYTTKNVQITKNSDGTSTSTKKKARQVTKETPKTYKVQSGDTLWNIAKKEFNDGNEYKKLAAINNIANPNFLQIGQVLKLE